VPLLATLLDSYSKDIQAMTKLVAIVDDDDSMRSALQGLLKAVGLPANTRIQDTTNDVFVRFSRARKLRLSRPARLQSAHSD
jgi:hypothetical protein